MENSVFGVPIVNFASFNLNIDEKNLNSEAVQTTAKELYSALHEIGFVYLTNHGISDAEVEDLRHVSKEFFGFDESVKKKYIRRGYSHHGWVSVGRERLNHDRPTDFKESFSISRFQVKVWPDTELPNFKNHLCTFFDRCAELAHRVLYAIAISLNLPDKHFFRQSHHFNSEKGKTTLRMLHYPSVSNDAVIKPGQIRCGEHTDYGSITLLFQDNIGGLEVLSRSGNYVPAKPLSGAVLVNVADIMQRWTADRLVSTKHRVLFPAEESGKRVARYSTAFFVQPDDDCLIECLDGSAKYEPITAIDYLNRCFSDTFGYRLNGKKLTLGDSKL